MIARLWPFVLGSIALGLDAYVVAGLLPDISSDLGASPGTVGLGVAAFTAAYAVVGPVLAGPAGRRATGSLLAALGVFMLANIASAAAPSAGAFIASRLAAGAAAGVYSPLSSTVAATSVPEGRRGRALSLVLAGLACGTVFGVPLGLLVADSLSWRWTFELIAVLGAIAAIGVMLRGRGVIDDVHAPSFIQRLRTLRRPANVLTMMVTLLTGVASLGLYTYLVPVLGDFGKVSNSVLLIWVWGVGGAVGALAIGRVVDVVRRPTALTAAITIVLAAVLCVVAVNPPLAVMAAAVGLWGLLGWSSLAPQQHTLMTANAHDGTTAVAANASANYLGSAIGSAAGAALIGAQISGSAFVLFAAAPAAVAFLLQLVRMRITADAEN